MVATDCPIETVTAPVVEFTETPVPAFTEVTAPVGAATVITLPAESNANHPAAVPLNEVDVIYAGSINCRVDNFNAIATPAVAVLGP